MNTVEALNVLGKALCGDSFEVKPGLTDAETILEIAKNYEGGGESEGGVRVIDFQPDASGEYQYEPGLSAKDFMGALIGGGDETSAGYYLISFASYSQSNGYIVLNVIHDSKAGVADRTELAVMEWRYYPETGILQFLFPD